ncbi:hypothetical protein ACFQL4_10520 [Halosimplex aquaticum]
MAELPPDGPPHVSCDGPRSSARRARRLFRSARRRRRDADRALLVDGDGDQHGHANIGGRHHVNADGDRHADGDSNAGPVPDGRRGIRRRGERAGRREQRDALRQRDDGVPPRGAVAGRGRAGADGRSDGATGREPQRWVGPLRAPGARVSSGTGIYRGVRRHLSGERRCRRGPRHRRRPVPREVELVLVHEFVHVLQYNDSDYDELSNQTDYTLGHALGEGAAVYAAQTYGERYGASYDGKTPVELRRCLYERVGDADREWIGQYYFGARYYQQRVDSPADFSTVYRSPPRTTEQLIHGLEPGAEPPATLSVAVESSGDWRAERREQKESSRSGPGCGSASTASGSTPRRAGGATTPSFGSNATAPTAWRGRSGPIPRRTPTNSRRR